MVKSLGNDDSMIARAVSNGEDAAKHRSVGVIERYRARTTLDIAAKVSFMALTR
jgi:hypothetical protein